MGVRAWIGWSLVPLGMGLALSLPIRSAWRSSGQDGAGKPDTGWVGEQAPSEQERDADPAASSEVARVVPAGLEEVEVSPAP